MISASVETAIVDFAKENGIDLIVLGSKGYSGIKKSYSVEPPSNVKSILFV